jgi:ABC-2 type transport system permease protein
MSINWIGFYTLYKKEILRFLNVWVQTVFSPIVTLVLFLAVFTVALGLNRNNVLGHDYGVFILPGLICMQILQNAFANTSSSLMIAKIQGNIVDILYPPLNAMEVTCAMLLGAITRGLIIGLFSILVMIPFTHIPIYNIFIIILFALLGSSMLACLGFITGLWAQKFDNMATITNFIVVPLSFLSGTFYSIQNLHSVFYLISHVNPFFYAIDGFRYGFLGQADGSVILGFFYLTFINLALWVTCYILFKKGYRIKS